MSESKYKIEAVKATPYMSIVEGRRPRQKVHTQLSHAKNAFDSPRLNPLAGFAYTIGGRPGGARHTHGWGAIFEFVDGDWKLLFEVPQPTEADGHEGKWRTEYETRPWRKS